MAHAQIPRGRGKPRELGDQSCILPFCFPSALRARIYPVTITANKGGAAQKAVPGEALRKIWTMNPSAAALASAGLCASWHTSLISTIAKSASWPASSTS